MLMKDPFDPASAMALTAFRSFRLTWAEVPDSSRAVFSTCKKRVASGRSHLSARIVCTYHILMFQNYFKKQGKNKMGDAETRT